MDTFPGRSARQTGLPVIAEIMERAIWAVIEKYADVSLVRARNIKKLPLKGSWSPQPAPCFPEARIQRYGQRFDHYERRYVLNEGNMNVLLCERGIRTFENATRVKHTRSLQFRFTNPNTPAGRDRPRLTGSASTKSFHKYWRSPLKRPVPTPS